MWRFSCFSSFQHHCWRCSYYPHSRLWAISKQKSYELQQGFPKTGKLHGFGRELSLQTGRLNCLNTNILEDVHTHNHLNDPLSGTIRVGQYQKKHSPTHTHPDHQTSFINIPHLLLSILLVQFTFLKVLFHNLSPGPLWSPSWSKSLTSHSIHFFTRSLSPFCNTCPYHRSLFWVVPMLCLSLSSLQWPLISAHWSATSFSFLTDHVSLPYNILFGTQLLYNLSLLPSSYLRRCSQSNFTYCLARPAVLYWWYLISYSI